MVDRRGPASWALCLLALSYGMVEGEKVKVPKTRYLLYDCKEGEGFNVQRQLFSHAASILDALQHNTTTGNWTLVLPTWCWLAHWDVNPSVTQKPWGTFFDTEFMRKRGLQVWTRSLEPQVAHGLGTRDRGARSLIPGSCANEGSGVGPRPPARPAAWRAPHMRTSGMVASALP